MNMSSLYNRLIYRDFLGYGLPGAIFFASLMLTLSPIKVNDTFLNLFEKISMLKIFLLIGIGFVFCHLIAVIPRKVFRKESIRVVLIQNAINDFRIKAILPLLIQFFNTIFGEDSWQKTGCIQKLEILDRYTSSNKLQTDMLYRIRSIKIFLENSAFLLPTAIFLLIGKINIMNFSIITSAIIFLVVGFILAILSVWGRKNVEVIENQEIFSIFIEHNISNKDKIYISFTQEE